MASEKLAVEPAGPGTLGWLSLGVFLLLLGWSALGALTFVMDLFARSDVLGSVGSAVFLAGFAAIAIGLGREWRGLRAIRSVQRLREELSGAPVAIATVRSAARDWTESVAAWLDDPSAVVAAIESAATPSDIHDVLRNRVLPRLRAAAGGIGRRAALQGGAMVAISPHHGWDAVVAGIRSVLVIRQVARVYGLRPGLAGSFALLRRVAITAAGTAGTDLLATGLADHALSNLPVIRHLAEAIPGAGLAAVRLYRLADITALACSPIPY